MLHTVSSTPNWTATCVPYRQGDASRDFLLSFEEHALHRQCQYTISGIMLSVASRSYRECPVLPIHALRAISYLAEKTDT